MNNPIHSLISELEQEAGATRRLLERVPADKLAWKPHNKSMSLGQLAFHVATIPGGVSQLLLVDQFDARTANFAPKQPESTSEILEGLEKGLVEAREVLQGISAEAAGATWKLTFGERELMSIPRIAVARTILLNHWYHHRGQLTVYLRLLDVPLPTTYGRSADDNPFAS